MPSKESAWSNLLTPPNAKWCLFQECPTPLSITLLHMESISQESPCFMMTKYSCDYKALQGLHRRCFVNWMERSPIHMQNLLPFK
jgi:hypothetical protein